MTLNYFRQYIAGYTVANVRRYPIRCRVTKANALEWILYPYAIYNSVEAFYKIASTSYQVIALNGQIHLGDNCIQNFHLGRYIF